MGLSIRRKTSCGVCSCISKEGHSRGIFFRVTEGEKVESMAGYSRRRGFRTD